MLVIIIRQTIRGGLVMSAGDYAYVHFALSEGEKDALNSLQEYIKRRKLEDPGFDKDSRRLITTRN